MIMAGLVEVNHVRVDKPGCLVGPASSVILKERQPVYVSRGGHKLEAALRYFSADVKDLTILDVGASTGGFTDCLLQHGAGKVIAVDVGYGQLDWKLRQDPRVVVMEKRNIRYLEPEELAGPVDGAVIDASFISLRLVVPAVSRLLPARSFIIALVKPQFELERGQVGKGGVVRNPDLHEKVIVELTAFFQGLGWTVRGHTPSPLLGPKGNREFLICLTR